MIELDGGKFSGSGTIVRFGTALAALAGQDLRIVNVRAKREKPGLRLQHAAGVQAVAQLCQGQLEGAEAGSRELTFRPGPLRAGGAFEWDIGSAGSTTMMALALLPVATFAVTPCVFRITGGLFQDFAPSPFHMQEALLPLLHRMGLKAQLTIVRPGYIPKGGGVIELRVTPVQGRLKPLTAVKRGADRDLRLWGVALSSHLEQRRVSERMAASCQEELSRRGLRAELRTLYETEAVQPGAALALFAASGEALLGADQAGAPRRTSESIGRRVARALLEDWDSWATVDRYLADQLIIFAALAEGVSEFRIPSVTEHVRTNAWLVETILGARIELKGQVVRVEGVGYERR